MWIVPERRYLRISTSGKTEKRDAEGRQEREGTIPIIKVFLINRFKLQLQVLQSTSVFITRVKHFV